MFPNDGYMISAGDEYALVDIGQPESYITVAETELKNRALAYLAEHCEPVFPYRVTVDPAFLDENPTGFEIGDRVTVVDTDYGINGLYRISNLVYKVYEQVYELYLSDTAPLTRRKEVELRLEALERTSIDTKSGTVEHMRESKETSNE
jgi:hypothetical protein